MIIRSIIPGLVCCQHTQKKRLSHEGHLLYKYTVNASHHHAACMVPRPSKGGHGGRRYCILIKYDVTCDSPPVKHSIPQLPLQGHISQTGRSNDGRQPADDLLPGLAVADSQSPHKGHGGKKPQAVIADCPNALAPKPYGLWPRTLPDTCR